MEKIEKQDWDIDFYQVAVYKASHSKIRYRGDDQEVEEVFNDEDREHMLKIIKAVQKPCLVFKVLGGNRKCGSNQEVKATLQYTLQ